MVRGRPFDGFGEALNRGRFEESTHRHRSTELTIEPGDHLCGEQRVASNGKEVVVDADGRHSQDVAPDSGEDRLERCARRFGSSSRSCRGEDRVAADWCSRICDDLLEQRRELIQKGGDSLVREQASLVDHLDGVGVVGVGNLQTERELRRRVRQVQQLDARPAICTCGSGMCGS